MTQSSRSRGVIFAYGLPGLVTAIPIIPIAILLPSYYADELGLGLTVTGAALLCARLIDFLSDLLVGFGVDRARFGRYRYKHWVAVGAIVGGLGLIQLAYPGDGISAAYLGFWSVVLFTGWTMVMVPYTAWGAELSDDQHQRSVIVASREVAGLVGMLLALALPVAFLLLAPAEQFVPLGLIASATIIVGIPALGVALARVPEPTTVTSAVTVRWTDLFELLRFRPYRSTLLCWLVNSFANGLPAVLFPVVVGKYFGFEEKSLFLLLMIYFGAAIACAAIWLAAAKRYGKARTWIGAIVLNVTIFAGVLLIDPNYPDIFFLVCFLTGATLAADLILPASIQADVMEHDRMTNGKRRTATAFALWSMATKLALAFAVGVAFIGLGTGGESFDPQSPTAVRLLLVLYVCVPIVAKLFVAVSLLRLPPLPIGDRDTPPQIA